MSRTASTHKMVWKCAIDVSHFICRFQTYREMNRSKSNATLIPGISDTNYTIIYSTNKQNTCNRLTDIAHTAEEWRMKRDACTEIVYLFKSLPLNTAGTRGQVKQWLAFVLPPHSHPPCASIWRWHMLAILIKGSETRRKNSNHFDCLRCEMNAVSSGFFAQ